MSKADISTTPILPRRAGSALTSPPVHAGGFCLPSAAIAALLQRPYFKKGRATCRVGQ